MRIFTKYVKYPKSIQFTSPCPLEKPLYHTWLKSLQDNYNPTPTCPKIIKRQNSLNLYMCRFRL